MTDAGILEAHRPLDEPSDRASEIIADVTAAFSATVVGQHRLRDTLLIGLLTGGHILLESAPGLAKTTAAQTIARSVGGVFTRIQCTPDLLPSDITGTQIFDARVASFTTRLGPVHSNFVLLDEINRSSAKTQSAMLEAMQERQTTIGGQTHRLPDPFLVLATQNPLDRDGTHPLPEAQLDRFLLKDVVEYPTPAEEFEILSRLDLGVLDAAREVAPVASLDDIRFLQQQTREVFVDESIRRYIITLAHITRNTADFISRDLARYVDHGASPRASIAFLQSTRALALLSGRRHVIPEDVKQLGHAVLRHRLALGYAAEPDGVTAERVIDAIFGSIATP
jgi:MoxR-like ATPase